IEDGYQDIFEYDREYSSHSETDNEALYTDIEVYNEALTEGIETVDETQLEDMNEEICDSDSEDEEKQKKILVLNVGMPPFDTWDIAEKYLNDYAKQQGFCLYKRRRALDSKDNTIIRRRTYECSHSGEHEAQK
ncbi:19103_t:CDS:1, partial [Gigaspora margarita]